MLKMIDTLSSDIEKEMAVAQTEEADAQAFFCVAKQKQRNSTGRKTLKSLH